MERMQYCACACCAPAIAPDRLPRPMRFSRPLCGANAVLCLRMCCAPQFANTAMCFKRYGATLSIYYYVALSLSA